MIGPSHLRALPDQSSYTRAVTPYIHSGGLDHVVLPDNTLASPCRSPLSRIQGISETSVSPSMLLRQPGFAKEQ
jgi:hypothetical protein